MDYCLYPCPGQQRLLVFLIPFLDKINGYFTIGGDTGAQSTTSVQGSQQQDKSESNTILDVFFKVIDMEIYKTSIRKSGCVIPYLAALGNVYKYCVL